ncbi:Orf2/integrase/recombinase fusion protein [Xanthomonas oryzae pv. oryzae KACC 10331]|uniref:Orf2/integrase/recombinase fusion protein n=1 Tax=Xanthomonas oryzae pv. oryzae (strain KACC10331 / KXO85) TaxID=291331 RepID=Q5GYB0_XANOR|nr:Orf2/integrase/recombinase fusion protein [Xanthomonas oryzae pv. oryzae KACC 10331]
MASDLLSEVHNFGSLEFQVGCRACGLNVWKSSLPAIRKMTVLMVDRRLKPRALRLADWNQAIDGFKEAVGLTGLRPGDDAVHVAAHEGCDFLHRLDLGSHHADAPVLEHLAHHVDLLSVKRLAQLLLVEPRAGRPCELGCRDQPVQCCAGRRFEAEDILEQRPAHALEGLLGALLDAPGFVHGRVRMSDNVELVEGDLRVGQLVAYALDEPGRHVDAHRGDLFGRAAMSCQIGSQQPSRLLASRPSVTKITRRAWASAAKVT